MVCTKFSFQLINHNRPKPSSRFDERVDVVLWSSIRDAYVNVIAIHFGTAAGLYFLAELVEEYTSITSKIIRYIIWVRSSSNKSQGLPRFYMLTLRFFKIISSFSGQFCDSVWTVDVWVISCQPFTLQYYSPAVKFINFEDISLFYFNITIVHHLPRYSTYLFMICFVYLLWNSTICHSQWPKLIYYHP